MNTVELHHTLIELLGALAPSRRAGVRVRDVEIIAPMVTSVKRHDGRLVVSARPASSIYRYGFEPVVNTVRVTAEELPCERAPNFRSFRMVPISTPLPLVTT